MKYYCLLFFALLLFAKDSLAQRRKKKKKQETVVVEKKLVTTANLVRHISILASDSLQGRRTGTKGEQLAADYIKSQFTQIGLVPKGSNASFLQPFPIFDGLVFEKKSFLLINNNVVNPGAEFFPLNISSNFEKEEFVSPSLQDMHTLWFFDLKEELKKQEKNIHFDIQQFVEDKAKELELNGAGGVLVYNSGNKADNLAFDTKTKKTALKIPVVYIKHAVFKKYFPKTNDVAEVKLKIAVEEKTKTGTNVIGYINNNAATTVILGAHYDHLGMGEDKNSLHTGSPAIHNGADDNASGIAALLELARILNSPETKRNSNYLFIAFSGEELGLYGSKFFTENSTIPLQEVNYMINMDMVGRLNDSTKAYTIGGYGTSPAWAKLIKEGIQENGTSIKLDSSGTGPSDHTSFYRKNTPVLFFFTGTHSDYHKPSDDAEKINISGIEKLINTIYTIIEKTDTLPKLDFLKTREQASGSSSTRFTVSLGIMPDYTFSGVGVRADGVSEGKLAQKIGIQAGDVLTKLGDYTIENVESYMKVLSKFKKGDSTVLKTTRNGKEIVYNITF